MWKLLVFPSINMEYRTCICMFWEDLLDIIIIIVVCVVFFFFFPFFFYLKQMWFLGFSTNMTQNFGGLNFVYIYIIDLSYVPYKVMFWKFD